MSELAPEDPTAGLSVRVVDAHVRYKVYRDDSRSLRARIKSGRRESVHVHALRGVSLDVSIGESIGVIGSNGSGKSTLLRAIAGVQSLASGSVLVRGDARLLGVGAALKPLLSGYRNIYLGGLAMGLSRRDVEERIDSVVEFTGLADSIHLPMNTYSVGMRSRLSFAVATMRVPDVLLVDEALAVGDRSFRERSLERLNEIRSEAGSVVLVTHNLVEIRQTCARTVWLENGVLRADGPTDSVLDEYQAAS